MSFISGAMDKSVFNKGSYVAAIGRKDSKGNFENGYAVVRIKPSGDGKRLGLSEVDPEIIGVMDYSQGEGLTFAIESTWTGLGGMGNSVLPEGISKFQPVFDKVNNAVQIGGATSLGSSFASKLIYHQSGYLVINIPMMVVDWKGTAQPLVTAMILADYCLPKDIGGLNDVLQKMKDWVNEQLTKAKNSENFATKLAGLIGDTAINTAEGAIAFLENQVQDLVNSTQNQTLKDAYDTYKKTLAEGEKDLTTLRASPIPVDVEIGKYFKKKDMVITNLSYTFSKEMTRMGPLYVKFQLGLSSRKIMVGAKDTGLVVPNNASRYSETSLTGIQNGY